ncbi:hypothetical protein BKA93DRAFT_425427 [Sparassis latifolia]
MQTVMESSLAILELGIENERLAMEMETVRKVHEKERREWLSARKSSHDAFEQRSSSQADGASASPSQYPSHCKTSSNFLPQMRWSPSFFADHSHLGVGMPGADHNTHDRTLGKEADLRGYSDAEFAAEIQRQFDEEDRHLRGQDEKPANNVRRNFSCTVCLEEKPEDSVARLAPCGHSFCRECIRKHVSVKIDERRYAILCPMCMAEEGKGEYGVVSDSLLQQIGITEAQYRTWTEMGLAQISMFLARPKCQNSASVFKPDIDNIDIVPCPFNGCNHVWCKFCQQAIDLNGPRHSCDGSSEFISLMQKEGWKRCPGCNTPIEKVNGCNHITCMTPGCNTHFCYLCGESIIRSPLRRDVEDAVTAHYSQCQLIEPEVDHYMDID